MPPGLQRELDDQRVPARIRDHPAQVARPPVQAAGELLVVAGLVLQLPGGLRVGPRGEFGVPQRPHRLDAPGPPVHLADQGQRMTGAERVDVPPGQDRRGDRGGHAVDGRVIPFQCLIKQPHDVPPPGLPYRPLRSHVPTLRKRPARATAHPDPPVGYSEIRAVMTAGPPQFQQYTSPGDTSRSLPWMSHVPQVYAARIVSLLLMSSTTGSQSARSADGTTI